MNSIILTYQSSVGLDHEEYLGLVPRIENVGFTSLKDRRAWYSDIIFGGRDDVYGRIFYKNETSDKTLTMEVVVNPLKPKNQMDAVDALLLELPIFKIEAQDGKPVRRNG